MLDILFPGCARFAFLEKPVKVVSSFLAKTVVFGILFNNFLSFFAEANSLVFGILFSTAETYLFRET